MTNWEIYSQLTRVVDQFYKQSTEKWIKESQLHYIGGVCQCALFLLDFDKYMRFKQYIYNTYGYDPGGCADEQLSVNEIINKVFD